MKQHEVDVIVGVLREMKGALESMNSNIKDALGSNYDSIWGTLSQLDSSIDELSETLYNSVEVDK